MRSEGSSGRGEGAEESMEELKADNVDKQAQLDDVGLIYLWTLVISDENMKVQIKWYIRLSVRMGQDCKKRCQ